jgi:hypothetical protein
MHREHLSWHASAKGADANQLGKTSEPTSAARQSAPAGSRILVTRRSIFLRLQSGAADLLISPRSSWQARHSL